MYEKVRFNNKLDKATVLDIGKTGDSTQVNFNAKHTKINADDVNIGASVVPAGYKLIVDGGDTRIQNGTSKYLDLANDKVGIRTDADLIDLGCDVKIVGSTCIEGDLKVSGVLKNGADKPYILQEDHDDDITTITDILTDITDAIPTDENGNNEIPANEKLAYKSQITGLQTQVDNLNYPTIENVDDLFDARLQSVGVVDDNLALLHYDKTEVDALIPDVSEYETTAQLDTRLADYTTISLFEAHESLMELELSNQCNLECVMCSGELSSGIRKNRDNLPPLPMIYDDSFREQLHEFIPHLTELRFNGGEPFAQKIVLDICDDVARINPSLKINVATNGTVINKRVRHIMENNNLHINISIDSLIRSRYEEIRINGNFNKLMVNTTKFYEYCKDNRSQLSIMVNPMRNNWQEMVHFVEFTEGLNASLWFNTILYPEQYAIWNLPTSELKEIYTTMEYQLSKLRRSCKNYDRFEHLVKKQVKNWLLDSYII